MIVDPVLDSRQAWARLGLGLAIGIVGNAGMWMATLVLPAVQADFGASRGAASLIFAATMIGFATGNFLLGRVVDRFGIATTLTVAAVALAACFSAATLSPSIWVLFVLQVMIGFATAACFGPLIADMSLWFHARKGIAVAIAASGNYLSGVFWPPLLSALTEPGDWRSAYLIVAASAIVLMLPLAQTLRRRLPEGALTTAETAAALKAQGTGLKPWQLQALLGAAGIGCCVAMAMPQVHIVALCVDLGFTAAIGGQMLSLMLVGGVVSRLVSGWLADRLGGVATLLIGSVLQTVALVLYLPADGLVSLYVVSLVFGLSQGGIVPSYAVIVREYLPPREAGRRVGLVLMLTILGMAVGGWLSGAIYDWTGSYRAAFLNGIAFNLANIAIVLFIALRGRARGGASPASVAA
jgi:MFS family permease